MHYLEMGVHDSAPGKIRFRKVHSAALCRRRYIHEGLFVLDFRIGPVTAASHLLGSRVLGMQLLQTLFTERVERVVFLELFDQVVLVLGINVPGGSVEYGRHPRVEVTRHGCSTGIRSQ